MKIKRALFDYFVIVCDTLILLLVITEIMCRVSTRGTITSLLSVIVVHYTTSFINIRIRRNILEFAFKHFSKNANQMKKKLRKSNMGMRQMNQLKGILTYFIY